MDETFTFVVLVVSIEQAQLLLDTDILALLHTRTDKGGIEFVVYFKYLIWDRALFLWLSVLFSLLRFKFFKQWSILRATSIWHCGFFYEFIDIFENVINHLLFVIMQAVMQILDMG